MSAGGGDGSAVPAGRPRARLSVLAAESTVLRASLHLDSSPAAVSVEPTPQAKKTKGCGGLLWRLKSLHCAALRGTFEHVSVDGFQVSLFQGMLPWHRSRSLAGEPCDRWPSADVHMQGEL